MALERSKQDYDKEGRGWMLLAGVIFLFPALFFFCAYLPIWMGWASRW